jgi:hypothetical protein
MATTEKHPKTSIPRGRCYLCIGPNCWGKAFSAVDAEKNAKQNYFSSGTKGWKFIMYDAPPDVYVDDWGSSVYRPALYYQPDETNEDTKADDKFTPIGYPAKELYRYKMPK